MNPRAGTLLIRGARQLVTLRGPKEPRRGATLSELSIIQDGSILIRDGVLLEVGPTRRVENLAEARGAVEIDAAGRVVMPGFVDSHTHLIVPGPRHPCGGDQDASLRMVQNHTGKRLELRARSFIEAMARHGTTTLEAKTGCCVEESAETKVLRVLAALDAEPLDVVSTVLFRAPQPGASWAGTVENLVDLLCTETLPKIRRRRLARFIDVVWDHGEEPEAAAARLVSEASGLGFHVKLHADHVDAGAAVGFAVANQAVSIDHLEHAGLDEGRALAGARTVATLLPGAAFFAGGGRYAPGRELIDAGAAVALASDFGLHATPTLNMQTVLHLACRRMAFTPEEAISAATIVSVRGTTGLTGRLSALGRPS